MIYCETNNLNSDDTPEKIANDIIQLDSLVVSGICPSRDRFNQKANDANQLLAGKYGENDFDSIPYNYINTRLHLDRDGIHLNRNGIYQISYSFREYFNNS